MDEDIKLVKKIIIRSIIGVIALVVILTGFNIVGAGERGVVLRMGKVSRVTEPGLMFKIPFGIESVKKLEVRTLKEEVKADSASKDLQVVSTVIALNYHLSPENVGNMWKTIGAEYKSRVIDPAIQESVKSATAKYTAEELITKRQIVKDDIKLSLVDRLVKEFIVVDEVSIVNFDFSASFNQAIEAKVTAEQSALAAKNKLEQVKFEAEQRITTAKAEAEAIRIQAQAITQQGGEAYVQLKSVEKWNGVMPVYMLGNSTPFINIK